MAELTLFLSAVAAIATVVLLAWGWADRPRLTWAIREFPIASYDDSGRIRISALEIYAEGSGAAHAVHLTPINCEIHTREYDPQGPGEDDPFVMQMTSASPPLSVEIWHPDSDAPRALEIRWSNMRPPRALGFRLDLVDHLALRWRWRMTSLRFRRWLPIRTAGDWVPHHPRLRHSIPKTDRTMLGAAPAPTLRTRAGRVLRSLRGQWDRLWPFGRS